MERGHTALQLPQLKHASILAAPYFCRFNRKFGSARWGAMVLGDEVMATALLDRLLHHAEVISINGRSYRMRQRMLADQAVEKPDKRERGERRVERNVGAGTNDENETNGRSVADKKGGSILTA